MMSTLESDVLYRARQLALDGPGLVFEELHSSVDFRSGQIHLKPVCQHLHQDVELALNGEGIQLVPVIFRGCGRMFQVAPEWQPMIAYGARGTGLWYQKPSSSSQSLELALGAGRARVLQVIRTPISNAEVAYRARISAATASQHLMRLTKAGLVRSQRSGKRVYYSLTERGENLLALFETSD
jgi:DNA-binding transcriptional ArsR family regulator